MVDCIDFSLEKIRAVITIGGYEYVTPGSKENTAGFINSFSIQTSREQTTASLSCVLEAWVTGKSAVNALTVDEGNLGARITVDAGATTDGNLDNLPRLFTGYVMSASPSPHWEDSRIIVFDISAEDTFAEMKYGPKFSRRFRIKDDAYAVITEGERRQGGRLTQLKRFPPGRRGIDTIYTGSTGGMEHSPLQVTPDPRPYTPGGVRGQKSKTSTNTLGRYRFVPSQVFSSPGGKISASIIDQETGERVGLEELQTIVGRACMCHLEPNLTSTTGHTGIDIPSENYPVAVEYGEENALIFTITGPYPAKVTFIHPRDGGSCSIDFAVVPPHDHRSIDRGGSAVASFDAFTP